MDQNYLRDDTLRAANALLVSAQSRLALARQWGGGEVASADGMRFVVPVQAVHAGPNPKYFGLGRGVTWYNLLSDQLNPFKQGYTQSKQACWPKLDQLYCRGMCPNLNSHGRPLAFCR